MVYTLNQPSEDALYLLYLVLLIPYNAFFLETIKVIASYPSRSLRMG